MIRNRKSVRGISLLELMLSLAIIAVLVVTAGRYYTSARSARQVNDAVSMLTTVMTALDNYFWTYKTFKGATSSSQDVSMTVLANQGLVPSDFTNATANPWGGNITVTSNNATEAKITMSNISESDCTNLKEIMQQRGLSGSCDSSGNYSAIYSSTSPGTATDTTDTTGGK
ncbi:MAG: type II secretion system protein [Coxiellaceae bacterium]|nr:MAG: type II secretion system protein [Coxiellaceae bacterium]